MGNSLGTSELSTTTGQVSWYNKLRGRKPAMRWAISAILGGVFISVLGDPSTVESGTSTWRLILPVLVILVYTYLGYKDLRPLQDLPALHTARIGQLADSVYYLGFLWTLWALIDSFVIHEHTIADAAFRAFGYALSTTATGMFLRLWLMQFSYTAESQYTLSEETVEDRIARFTRCIDKAVRQIDGFTRTFDQLTVSVSKAAELVNSRTDELIESLRSTGPKVESGVTAIMSDVQVKLDKTVENVNNSVDRIGVAVDSAVKGVADNVVIVGQKLSDHSEQVCTRLDESSRRVDETVSRVASTLPEEIKHVAESLSGLSERIRNIQIRSDAIDVALQQELKDKIGPLQTNAQKLSGVMDQLTVSITNAREALTTSHKPWWKRIRWS